MIDRQHIVKWIEDYLQSTPLFLVDVNVSISNKISIFIDGMEGVKIEDCIAVSRLVEGNLDRELEDFELNVSSAGLDLPFRVWKQYEKNVGKTLKVTLSDDKILKGKLQEVGTDYLILLPEETSAERKKRQKQAKEKGLEFKESEPMKINQSDIKETKIIILFK